jgi:uncharacterized protein YicC (UPF0701 family)
MRRRRASTASCWAQGRDRGRRARGRERGGRRAGEAAVIAGFTGAGRSRRDAPREGQALGQILPSGWTRSRSRARRSRARPQARRRSRRGSPSRSRRCSIRPTRFDPDRLHQEAILIAAKADIREELDRLAAHVAQARELIDARAARSAAARFPGAGAQPRIQHAVRQIERRRADQHRARAENVVEQFREQVQNLE